MKHYQYLGTEERFYIWQARREGNTQTHIAQVLGRHPSTVCRESKRNTYAQCHRYTYDWARHIVKYRKQVAKQHKHRTLTDELAPVIEQLLRPYLSPKQVSGYLKKHHGITSAMKRSIGTSTGMRPDTRN